MSSCVEQTVVSLFTRLLSLRFAKSPELFASTCATLFARMLNTVPRGVEFTEVIEPLPVKPASIALVLHGDALKLSGLVRVCTFRFACPLIDVFSPVVLGASR
jgi:hypothetical protein